MPSMNRSGRGGGGPLCDPRSEVMSLTYETANELVGGSDGGSGGEASSYKRTHPKLFDHPPVGRR